jgi:hypothetical protein
MKRHPEKKSWRGRIGDGAFNAIDCIELLGEVLHLGGRVIAALFTALFHLLDGF